MRISKKNWLELKVLQTFFFFTNLQQINKFSKPNYSEVVFQDWMRPMSSLCNSKIQHINNLRLSIPVEYQSDLQFVELLLKHWWISFVLPMLIASVLVRLTDIGMQYFRHLKQWHQNPLGWLMAERHVIHQMLIKMNKRFEISIVYCEIHFFYFFFVLFFNVFL